jgi:hypothetical protein
MYKFMISVLAVLIVLLVFADLCYIATYNSNPKNNRVIYNR